MNYVSESLINFCDRMTIATEGRKETSKAWNTMIDQYRVEWRSSMKCRGAKDYDAAIRHLQNAIKLCNDLKRELPKHPDITISENLLAIFKPSQWYKGKQTYHVKGGGCATTHITYYDKYSEEENREQFKELQYALNLKIKDCEVQIGYLKELKAGKGKLKAAFTNKQSY